MGVSIRNAILSLPSSLFSLLSPSLPPTLPYPLHTSAPSPAPPPPRPTRCPSALPSHSLLPSPPVCDVMDCPRSRWCSHPCHPPRWTQWHVEEMHKRSMCWACYLTVLTGLIGIFLCSGALTKFQILMRYYNDPVSGCARVQDPDSCLSSSTSSGSSRLMQALAMDNAMALAAMPCILGILGGFCPVLYAMVLARSRVIRADAMDRDVAIAGGCKRNKDLTGPQPVLRGPPPNLAMLNPVIERNTSTSSGEYSPNSTLGRAARARQMVRRHIGGGGCLECEAFVSVRRARRRIASAMGAEGGTSDCDVRLGRRLYSSSFSSGEDT